MNHGRNTKTLSHSFTQWDPPHSQIVNLNGRSRALGSEPQRVIIVRMSTGVPEERSVGIWKPARCSLRPSPMQVLVVDNEHVQRIDKAKVWFKQGAKRPSSHTSLSGDQEVNECRVKVGSSELE